MILILSLLLLEIPWAQADLTVVQQVEEMYQNEPFRKEQITLRVRQDRIRFDKGDVISSIIRSDKKLTFSIMHETQQYVVLPHDQVPSKNKSPSSPPTDPLQGMKIQATGKTEIISGFTCREVNIQEKDGVNTQLWISSDALDMKIFLQEFKSFMELGMQQFNFEKHPELQGMPIRVSESAQGKTLRRSTITRLDTSKIPDSFFEIPSGYQELRPDGTLVEPPPSPARTP